MTTVKIDFSDLRDAASHAKNVASELNGYAGALPGKINSPLSSLTGGSSGNTSNAASLATQKARSLRNRANAYESMASKLSSFADNAQSVDEEVNKLISKVADKRAEGLNWWQKFQYQVYKTLNGTFGAGEFGAAVKNILGWGDVIKKRKHELIKGALDWFKHGDGKYVLSALISVVTIVTTIVGMVLAFPASGIALLIAAATVIAGVVTVANSGVQIASSMRALSDKTEPGIARYKGTTKDVKTLAKRETRSAKLQKTADAVDMVGKVAGVVSFAGSFTTTRAADGVNYAKFDKKTIIDNLGGKFGFKYDSGTGKYSLNPKTAFGFGGENKIVVNDRVFRSKIFAGAEKLDNALKPADKILSTFSSLVKYDGRYDGYDDVKNTAKLIGYAAPGFSGYGKLMGFADDFGIVPKSWKEVNHQSRTASSGGGSW